MTTTRTKRVQSQPRTRLYKLSRHLALFQSDVTPRLFYLEAADPQYRRGPIYLSNAMREFVVITIPDDKTRLEVWSAEASYADGTTTVFFVIENPRTKREKIGPIVRTAHATGDPELANRFRNLDPARQLRQLRP